MQAILTALRERMLGPGASRDWRALAMLVAVVHGVLIPAVLPAQVGVDDPVLRSIEGIDIIDRPDAQLPLGLSFRDESGEFVQLSQYFDGEHPVVLNLAYFSCPMLCNLVVEGLVEAIEEIEWTLGDEFRVLTVSIDPRDRPATARGRKEILVHEMGVEDAIGGWNLLTGREENIRRVADTVGFGYEWNEYRKEYAHGAALFLLTPDGRVSRTLYGIKYDPEVLRLSLVEASDGKIGSALDKLFLLCFHYDPTTAQYGPMAARIMRAGGLLTLLAIAALITILNRARRRKLAKKTPDPAPAGDLI